MLLFSVKSQKTEFFHFFLRFCVFSEFVLSYQGNRGAEQPFAEAFGRQGEASVPKSQRQLRAISIRISIHEIHGIFSNFCNFSFFLIFLNFFIFCIFLVFCNFFFIKTFKSLSKAEKERQLVEEIKKKDEKEKRKEVKNRKFPNFS